MGIDLFNFELLGLNVVEALHDLLFFPTLPLIPLITRYFLLGLEWCSGRCQDLPTRLGKTR
jgi:hypothetical protein